MFLIRSVKEIVNLGVEDQMSFSISDRLKIINKFCLLCIAYTVPYILFSIYLNFFSTAFVFIVAQLLFVLSLYCNAIKQFLFSKILVIIATNFSVFYLSLFYGYSSGFHLYYFTSPLIVLSLFGYDERKKLIFGILLYIVSIIILMILHYLNFKPIVAISESLEFFLYYINVFLVLSFCILITANFANFNKKINIVLLNKNIVLEENETLLKNEIFERKATEVKLQESFHEVEILLSETHHRVKNNLAVISGILDLQMLSTDNIQIRDVLTDSRNRQHP